MPDQVFRFKKFSIRQNHAAMKVNTDSVLLGAWAAQQLSSSEQRLLDIGTGTGLLALMLVQKHPGFVGDAIEIDEGACRDAAHNFISYPHLKLHHLDFAQFMQSCPHKYDVIISNPPYFKPINTEKSNETNWPVAQRATARFHDALPFDVLAQAHQFLQEEGNIYIIIPVQLLDEIESSFVAAGLHKKYYTFVKTSENKEASRVLCKFGKEAIQFHSDSLILHHQNNSKTESYQQLVVDYYL